MTMQKAIPVNAPLLDGNERKYVLECLDTGWISSEGPFVGRFECEFAARVGRKYGVAVSNGSVALDAAVVALGIGPGDEVILPSFTIISCAAAIYRAGAIPVVVDSDPNTWNMDVAQIEKKITERTRAIMVVHIYGLPVDMEPVLAIARKHGIKIIEDAAEAHGQTYRSNGTQRPCGSFGDVSTFSFYPNKHVTTGEGGMIVTDDATLADECRSLRNLCFQASRRFVHEKIGWNYRLTNIQAALGIAQLETLDRHVERKRAMGARYTRLLEDAPDILLPQSATAYADNVYWVYGVVLGDSYPFDAAEAASRLAARQIGTRPFFWPIHEQPIFRSLGFFEGVSCPVAERIARRGFYLPSGLALTDDEIDYVAQVFKAVILP
jgi:perosamine synthetase